MCCARNLKRNDIIKQKTAIRIVASIAILACANMAEAQWTQYRGANGTSCGTANRMGNTTYHYNANGTSAGRATTMGNTTYHYNANGTSAGRSTTMGNTTYYYGPNGAPAGTATRTGW